MSYTCSAHPWGDCNVSCPGIRRDPPNLPFEALRARGADSSARIDGARTDGSIRRNELTYQHLELFASNLEHVTETRPFEYRDCGFSRTEEQLLLQPPVDEVWRASSTYHQWVVNIGHRNLTFDGRTSDGIIVMDYIARRRDVEEAFLPYMSEVALALYDHVHGPVETLRHILVARVENMQTRGLLHRLYPVSYMLPNVPYVFEHGTRQYDEILGTRIGQVIANLVIGGFEIGSCRITRITLFYDEEEYAWLRFDLRHMFSGGQEGVYRGW